MLLIPAKKNSPSATSWPKRTLAAPFDTFCSNQSSDSRVAGIASIAAIVFNPPT